MADVSQLDMDVLPQWLGSTNVLVVQSSVASASSAEYADWLHGAGAGITSASLETAKCVLLSQSPFRFDAAVVDLGQGACERVLAMLDDLCRGHLGCPLLLVVRNPEWPIISFARAMRAALIATPLTREQLVFQVACLGDSNVPDFRMLTAQATRRWLLSRQQSRLLYYNLWSLSNQEIADTMGVSVHTVQDYQRELRKKTGARAKDGYLRRLLECTGVQPPGTGS